MNFALIFRFPILGDVIPPACSGSLPGSKTPSETEREAPFPELPWRPGTLNCCLVHKHQNNSQRLTPCIPLVLWGKLPTRQHSAGGSWVFPLSPHASHLEQLLGLRIQNQFPAWRWTPLYLSIWSHSTSCTSSRSLSASEVAFPPPRS